MAQRRFLLPEGSTAYVGSKAYHSGQFMPSGINFYSVVSSIESSPGQIAQGAKSSYNAFVFVAAGATRQQIEDELDSLGDPGDMDWSAFRSYYGQVGGNAPIEPIGDTDMGEATDFPFGFNDPETPFDEWLDQQDSPIELPDDQEFDTLGDYQRWLREQGLQ